MTICKIFLNDFLMECTLYVIHQIYHNFCSTHPFDTVLWSILTRFVWKMTAQAVELSSKLVYMPKNDIVSMRGWYDISNISYFLFYSPVWPRSFINSNYLCVTDDDGSSESKLKTDLYMKKWYSEYERMMRKWYHISNISYLLFYPPVWPRFLIKSYYLYITDEKRSKNQLSKWPYKLETEVEYGGMEGCCGKEWYILHYIIF